MTFDGIYNKSIKFPVYACQISKRINRKTDYFLNVNHVSIVDGYFRHVLWFFFSCVCMSLEIKSHDFLSFLFNIFFNYCQFLSLKLRKKKNIFAAHKKIRIFGCARENIIINSLPTTPSPLKWNVTHKRLHI